MPLCCTHDVNDNKLFNIVLKGGTYGDSKQVAFVQRVRHLLRRNWFQIIYREKKGIVLDFLGSFKNARLDEGTFY